MPKSKHLRQPFRMEVYSFAADQANIALLLRNQVFHRTNQSAFAASLSACRPFL